jgi:xanthine dehydrogenase accessory factor
MDMELVKAITEGRDAVALATIIEVKGSSPRHAGTKMLVGRGGVLGTVGGGRGEAMALEACRQGLEHRGSALLRVEMVGDDVTGPAMVCGGSSTMLIELIEDRAPYLGALERLGRGERVLLVKRIRAAAPGPAEVAVALLDQDGATVCGVPAEAEAAARALADGQAWFDEAAGVFYDPVFPEEKLLILGGGHVAKALAGMAPLLGFQVTVVDDRPEFIAKERFPEGVRRLQAAFEPAVAEFPFDAATYAVIMTRGHQLDLACVRAVVKRPYRYAGFMGSARKTRLILDQLVKEGCDPAQVAALWAPIGMDIGAETPAELAVAILAELVAVRRNAGIVADLRRALPGRRG